MKLFTILFLVFAILVIPASATYDYHENFTGDSSVPDELSVLTAGTYGGTATVSDGNLTLNPGGASSGVGIYNESLWKHLKIYTHPQANGFGGGYKYSCFGISTNENVETTGAGGYNTKLKQGVYTVTGGTSVATTITLYEAWYVGETRYEKASPIATLTQLDNIPTVFDVVVYDNGSAAAFVNGVQKCTLSSTNVSSGGVLVFQGSYTAPWPSLGIDDILFASTVQSTSPPPIITWSSPAEVTTTQYQAAPTFSYESDQEMNYTVYINDTEYANGTGITGEYTPEKPEYGDYEITLSLINDAILEPTSKSYIWHYIPAPIVTPVIDNLSPSTDTTIHQYETIPFYADIEGSAGYPNPATVVWAINGSTDQTDTDVINSSYSFVGSEIGTYNISITATNTEGEDTDYRIITVIPNSITFSNIRYYPNSTNGTLLEFNVSEFTDGILIHGWAPTFNDSDTDKVYSWTYENGTIISTKTATEQNTTFDISVVPEGSYKIGTPGDANFSSVVTSGNSTVTATFTDSSDMYDNLTYSWDFENDGTIDSTEQNPVHVYPTIGLYTVNLTVSNDYGSDTELKTDHISVAAAFVIDTIAKWYWFFRSLKFWIIAQAVV